MRHRSGVMHAVIFHHLKLSHENNYTHLWLQNNFEKTKNEFILAQNPNMKNQRALTSFTIGNDGNWIHAIVLFKRCNIFPIRPFWIRNPFANTFFIRTVAHNFSIYCGNDCRQNDQHGLNEFYLSLPAGAIKYVKPIK